MEKANDRVVERVLYVTSESDMDRIVTNAINKAMKLQLIETNDNSEKLYTAEEACKLLRCSKPTLHRWKKEGIIPFARIGTNIRYKESDIKNLLNTKKR